MEQLKTIIIPCDYTNTDHLHAICHLMNTYINDKMGGGEPLSKLQQLRLVNGLEEHPTSIVLLAVHEDAFCGLLVAFELFSTFTVSPMINIHDLIVSPEYRGKGIGRLLLQHITAIGEARNCSRISLEVRMDNEIAQSLYKNIGFTEADPPMYYWRKKLK